MQQALAEDPADAADDRIGDDVLRLVFAALRRAGCFLRPPLELEALRGLDLRLAEDGMECAGDGARDGGDCRTQARAHAARA